MKRLNKMRKNIEAVSGSKFGEEVVLKVNDKEFNLGPVKGISILSGEIPSMNLVGKRFEIHYDSPQIIEENKDELNNLSNDIGFGYHIDEKTSYCINISKEQEINFTL